MKRPFGWKLTALLLLLGTAPDTTMAGTAVATASRRIRKSHHKRASSQQNDPLYNSYDNDGHIHNDGQQQSTTATTTTTPRALETARRRNLSSLLAQSNPGLLVSSSSTTVSEVQTQQAPTTMSFSARYKKAVRRLFQVPPLLVSKIAKTNPPKNTGYYYGLQPDRIFPYYDSSHANQKQVEQEKQLAMAETLSETLQEMKNMRKELQILRKEMYEMRKKITGEKDLTFDLEEEEVDPEVTRLAQQKRQRHFDRIGKEVEEWARKKLFEEDRDGNGWVEVACSKALARTVNPEGRTTCYLNWLKDSRGKQATPGDDREYPCIKVFTTIDAPLEDVCTYLSREEHMGEYNWILSEQRDLEEVCPHSKICWATSPQVLFLKPREFVTFVFHRWLKDGSVVMVNQAVEHKLAPAVMEEGKGKACRAYALRGATFFSPDPNEPNKTHLAMIAHAAPGGDFPQWMTKTAVNAIAPLEPFKLFHYINQNVQNAKERLEKLKLERTEEVSVPGRSNQPVGMAQIGFACFWPKGGGLLPPGGTTAASSTAGSSSESSTSSGNSTTISTPEPALVSS